jgi:hypothetical protein
MARPLLLLGGVLATIAVVRRMRAAHVPPPAPLPPPGTPPSSPAPHFAKPPEPRPKPSPAPTVTPAPTVAPSAAPATMAVSVTLPLGWRRLDPSELTPALVDTRDQVLASGFPVGTFAPFDLDGKHYAVVVERDETGLNNVASAVQE